MKFDFTKQLKLVENQPKLINTFANLVSVRTPVLFILLHSS